MGPFILLISFLFPQIIGYSDLPSRLPTQASTLYANNISKFLLSAGGKGHFAIDHEDEVIRGSLVLQDGEMMWPPPKPVGPPTPAPTKKPELIKPPETSPLKQTMIDTTLTGGKADIDFKGLNSKLEVTMIHQLRALLRYL